MPIGTYSYQPQHPEKINLNDIETFILSLLKDVCSTSTNPDLQACKVNYLADFNLGEEAQNGTKGLVGFFLAENNTSNVNSNAKLNDPGDFVHVAYDIGLTTKVNDLSTQSHNIMLQEIINGLTDNYNNGANYSVVINGETIQSVLSLNIPSDYPTRSLDKEFDINYLTSVINIIFKLNKIT